MDEKYNWSESERLAPTDSLLGNELSESLKSGYGGCTSPTTDSSLSISFGKEQHNKLTCEPSRKSYMSYSHEILLTFICSMDAICGGFIVGFTSPTVPQLKAQGLLDEEQATWFESMMPLGAIAGSLIVSWLAHLAGRKTTTFLTAVPSVLGWLCIIVAKSYVLLYIGRFFTGVAAGMIIIICILYIAESVSKEIRGALLMSFNMMLGLGVLVLYSLGVVLNTQWLATICIIPTFIMVIGLPFIPDSPRWLVQKGHHMDAAAALMWLRKDTFEHIQIELQEIEETMNHQKTITSQLNIRRDLRRVWKPLGVVVTLFLLQQFCGINVVQFNMQEIFAKAGFSGSGSSAGALPTIIIAIVQLMTPLLGLFVVDRFGRRPFFIVGGVVLIISTILMGFYFYFQDHLENYTWISIVALMTYISAHAVSWGTIPWMAMAEIIPLQFRGWASGCAASTSWIASFISLKVFLPIVNVIGWSGLFWVFSGICIVGVIFAILVMPETKDRSLENIEHEFSVSVHAQ